MNAAIRIHRGDPDEVEAAAVVAVITAHVAAATEVVEDSKPPRSAWVRPAHVRKAHPRSWAESRLPR